MTWTNFFLALSLIIAYILIGCWIGRASRKAWIRAQEKRVQGRYRATYQCPLPLTFYLFFPHQAFTRRFRVCAADFMLNRDGSPNELRDEDDRTYVLVHMLLWPFRALVNLLTGIMSIRGALQLRQSTDRQIERLEKQRRKLRSRYSTLKQELEEAEADIEDLIKRRNSELKALAFELAREAAGECDRPSGRKHPLLRPLPTEHRIAADEKKRTDLN